MCTVCLHVHCVHLFSVCVYMIQNLMEFTLISMLLCVGSVCPWPTSKATSHLEPKPFPSRLSQPWESPLSISSSTSLSPGNLEPERLVSRMLAIISEVEVSGSARPSFGWEELWEQCACDSIWEILGLAEADLWAWVTSLECSKSCGSMYSRILWVVWMWVLHYVCYCSPSLVHIIKTWLLSPESRNLDPWPFNWIYVCVCCYGLQI